MDIIIALTYFELVDADERKFFLKFEIENQCYLLMVAFFLCFSLLNCRLGSTQLQVPRCLASASCWRHPADEKYCDVREGSFDFIVGYVEL